MTSCGEAPKKNKGTVPILAPRKWDCPPLKSAWTLAAVALLAALSPAVVVADDPMDLEQIEQQAFRAAVERVAPSVVRIETVGGLQRVLGFDREFIHPHSVFLLHPERAKLVHGSGRCQGAPRRGTGLVHGKS